MAGFVSAFAFTDAGRAEIGIEVLRPEDMGRGLAREALAAWTAHLGRQGRTEAEAWVHPDNRRSMRLFAAAGFRDAGVIRDPQEPERTFRLWRLPLAGDVAEAG